MYSVDIEDPMSINPFHIQYADQLICESCVCLGWVHAGEVWPRESDSQTESEGVSYPQQAAAGGERPPWVRTLSLIPLAQILLQ